MFSASVADFGMGQTRTAFQILGNVEIDRLKIKCKGLGKCYNNPSQWNSEPDWSQVWFYLLMSFVMSLSEINGALT